MPVVARGGRFVYAQSLTEVAAFVGTDYAVTMLAPAALVARLDLVLAAAARYVGQIPSARLADTLPGRDRTLRQLGHHVFIVAEAFIDAAEGAVLSYESLAEEPPERLRTGADIAAFGEASRRRLAGWWRRHADDAGAGDVETYYGTASLHQVLERTAWHAGQHARQLMMVLDGLGIAPDGRLGADDFAGLPMPDRVWDG